MKHLLFLSLIMIQCLFLKGQTNKALNCKFLEKTVNDPSFQSAFHSCSDSSKPLTIIDSCSQFTTCNFITLCGKKINISTEWPRGISPNWDAGNSATDAIIVFKLEAKTEKHYLMHFWRPKTNHTLLFEVWETKAEVKVKFISSGDF